MDKPTYETAHQLLVYDSLTGIFIWRERPRELFAGDRIFRSWNGRYAGKRAGALVSEGYVAVSLFKRRVLAHRLAWLYVHGEWPEGDIDHINGVRDDNRIANLRSVSRRENLINSAIGTRNKTGCKGVDWFKPAALWRARIYDNGREVPLGYFSDINEAIAVRKKAEVEFGYHANHGRKNIRGT